MRVGVLELRVDVPSGAAERCRPRNTCVDLALYVLNRGQRLPHEVERRLIELLIRPRSNRLLRQLRDTGEHIEDQTVSRANDRPVEHIPRQAETRLPTVPGR